MFAYDEIRRSVLGYVAFPPLRARVGAHVYLQTDNDWLTGGSPHFFNGYEHFEVEFVAHDPVNVLVLMLGTNDLKAQIRALNRRSRVDASGIAESCARIALKARELNPDVEIVLVTPPVVCLNDLSKSMGYDETSRRISEKFPTAFSKVCAKYGFVCATPGLDMSKSRDGVHVTKDSNVRIANRVWKALEDLWSSNGRR